ncbi:acyltransferase [Pseudoflavitalea sp. G-6-1-2]|uniref:acyltransferase family protein n=1 Tax=Pseudoflavitalea sp. G-6-1-2 TaxID=2728841 RepID=UPI00146CC54D|nr:acyltransferase [Pseudoflavitalea sp. G-6-1-2]
MINSLFNADKILSRSRNPWMDYAKGICIMMPVYRHTFEGIANVGIGSYSYPGIRIVDVFTMGFRMPLFFMIAGAFMATTLNKKGIGEFVSAKFRTVMYPLLLWGSIQITLQLLFAGMVNAKREPFDYLNLILDPRKLEQFWYLNALFFVSVLYALLSWYAKLTSRHQLVLGLVLYGIASYCHIKNVHIGFLSGVSFYYLFFAVGDALHNIVLDEKHHKWLSSFKTTLIILPIFAAVEWYCTTLNLAHPEETDFYVQHQRQDIFFFSAIIGGLFMIHLSFMLQRFNVLRFLRVIGYHALYIYVAHLMVTAGVRVLLVRVLHIENIPLLQFTIWPAGVIIPIIMFNVCRKLGLTWIFTLKDDSVAKPAPATVMAREAVIQKEK